MESSPPFESWQAALPRRVAMLARIGPLHRFEAAKAGRVIDLAQHDLRTLCLMVFDAVIERMGLAAGASRIEIEEALQPLVLAAEPGASPERVAEVAGTVLDFLVNESDRRRAFREEVRVVEEGRQSVREISFHYLEQTFGAEDEPLYRATVEGINLYTGTLGLDMEDAHAANAAVLKYQIGRGRFREAVATARQAVAISTGYAQQVRRALEIARRDITQVDWAHDTLRILAQARDHLRTRVDADNEICAAVEAHQDDADPGEQRHIAELIENVRACQARHAELHRTVMAANDVWLGEHARQAFRPRSLGTLPDLEAALLRQALLLDDTRFEAERGWATAAAFLPPSAPELAADGLRLVEMLLAPLREVENRDADDFAPDREELPQAAEIFSEVDYRDVESLLDTVESEGAHLSDLLIRSREIGWPTRLQTLLYLTALREYGEAPDSTSRRVEHGQRSLLLAPYWGDDLRLQPVPETINEEGAA